MARLLSLLVGLVGLPLAIGCSGSGGASTTSGSTSGTTGGSTSSTVSTSSSGASSSSGTTGGGMTLTVTSPTDGAQVALGIPSDPLAVTVSYSVTGFILSTPGTCGVNLSTCGHIHITLDDGACNAPGKPYNNSGASGNDNALFEYCLLNTGAHVIHIDLHNDQHLLIPNSPVADLHVTTTATSTSPSVVIADPQPGSLVAIGADRNGSVPVMSSVSNFQLATPGTCLVGSGCGQVRFFINGDSCDGSGMYNAIDPGSQGPANPALVAFANCLASPDAGYDPSTGAYVLTAELFDDNGTAVVGATSGEVPITAIAP